MRAFKGLLQCFTGMSREMDNDKIIKAILALWNKTN
jgi:hypothetical protein